MQPIPHPTTTRRFAPPPDWSTERDGECGTLAIADLETPAGPFMESLWRPDADELKALNEGAAIVLGIRGAVHPVVYVSVSRPDVEPAG